MDTQFPFSEQFRIAGEIWAEKEYAAQLMEETKSSIMAQKQAMLGDIPVNRAEQTIKASRDWHEYLKQIVDARKAANLAKIQMEFARLQYYEAQSKEANARIEMKMG